MAYHGCYCMVYVFSTLCSNNAMRLLLQFMDNIHLEPISTSLTDWPWLLPKYVVCLCVCVCALVCFCMYTKCARVVCRGGCGWVGVGVYIAIMSVIIIIILLLLFVCVHTEYIQVMPTVILTFQNQPVHPGPKPPDNTKKLITLVTPVIFDSVPLGKKFGDVEKNAEKEYCLV